MNFLSARVAQASDDRIVLTHIGGEGTGVLEISFRQFDPSIKEVQIGVRPEHVQILANADTSTVLPVNVSLVEELGDMTVIHTDLPNGERLTAQSHGGRYSGISNASAKVDVSRVLMFDKDGQRLRSAKLS
jgi:lactose/L-arabinose transport system ATP-binding protein